MKLIIGALASGKREYIQSLGYSNLDFSDGVLCEKPVLLNLQTLVFQSPARSLDLLPALLQKEVISCCEVGSGVIPVLAEEREAREATGRLLILLAKEADEVIRLVCGIAQRIKG